MVDAATRDVVRTVQRLMAAAGDAQGTPAGADTDHRTSVASCLFGT